MIDDAKIQKQLVDLANEIEPVKVNKPELKIINKIVNKLKMLINCLN